MMGSKVDDTVSKFPVKVLPPIIGELDYEKINNIVQCLYGNAASLTTTLGGGRDIRGNIGIIMNPILYAKIVQTVYMAPDDPGTTPNIPGTVTVEERAQQRDHHKNHVNTGKAFKTIIIDVVKD